MPKTTVRENRYPFFREDEVRAPGEGGIPPPAGDAMRLENLDQLDFR
ncbi:MAG: hypothetical protein M5U11_01595 [Anaerolineales bacterium]|nr:hypothetical protein [Anaerolineales bacterium]MDX9937542.1 hypothetical protein [Anaerolineales bacterium]